MNDLGPTTWAGVRTRLVDAVRSLHHRGFLVLGEPDGTPRRTGLFRRSVHPPTRYVQLLRVDDVLYAECVGATTFGGTVEISPEVDARLVSWGWARPGNDVGTVPNYVADAPATDADRLADLCTRTPGAARARAPRPGLDGRADRVIRPRRSRWRCSRRRPSP